MLIAALLLPSMVSAEQAPDFTDYPAILKTKGLDAKEIIIDTDFARSYQTRLGETLEGGRRFGANFAGHYAAGWWGCGSGGCILGGIVDLRTGKVIELPQTTVQSDESSDREGAGIRIDPYSRLIVFRGIANETGRPVANYYVLEDDAFHLVHQEPFDAFPISAQRPSRSLYCNPVIGGEGEIACIFKGFDCGDDCSGHEEGYEWAEERGIASTSTCDGKSRSFLEGCIAYVLEQEQ